jgi:hypothetical protein
MDTSFITLQQTLFVSGYKHCGLLINGSIIVVAIVHHSVGAAVIHSQACVNISSNKHEVASAC